MSEVLLHGLVVSGQCLSFTMDGEELGIQGVGVSFFSSSVRVQLLNWGVGLHVED